MKDSGGGVSLRPGILVKYIQGYQPMWLHSATIRVIVYDYGKSRLGPCSAD